VASGDQRGSEEDGRDIWKGGRATNFLRKSASHVDMERRV